MVEQQRLRLHEHVFVAKRIFYLYVTYPFWLRLHEDVSCTSTVHPDTLWFIFHVTGMWADNEPDRLRTCVFISFFVSQALQHWHSTKRQNAENSQLEERFCVDQRRSGGSTYCNLSVQGAESLLGSDEKNGWMEERIQWKKKDKRMKWKMKWTKRMKEWVDGIRIARRTQNSGLFFNKRTQFFSIQLVKFRFAHPKILFPFFINTAPLKKLSHHARVGPGLTQYLL